MIIMLNFLYYILGGLPNSIYHFFVWKKLINNNEKVDRYDTIISIIIMSFGVTIIHDFINSFLRIFLIIILLVITSIFLFKTTFKKALAASFFTLVLLMISELIFTGLYMLFMNKIVLTMLTTPFGILLANILISIIAFLLTKIPFIDQIYFKIENMLYKLSSYFLVIFTIIVLFSINFLFVSSYYQIDTKILVLINTLISTIYLIIVFIIFNVQNKYMKISNKYNTTLHSLKEYEEILDKYKIMNHENKNDLLMIRSMYIKNEKGIDKYIDKLIDTKIKDDEKLMYETSIIPSGGLRAVIYSKLLIMKDKKINNNLYVDKKVRHVDLSNYGDEFVLDLCKIISIFIDNAIEASETIDEKEVLIQLFVDSEDRFNISITNTFDDNIDLTKIDTKGYTTKGNGHGYGLALAANILSKHKEIINNRKVENGIFNQTLIINKKI